MKQDAPTEFGTYLKQLRLARHLGIRELARKADVNYSVLARLEHGERRPRPDTLKALAGALGIPVTDLFAQAGYLTPADLPNLNAYLRVCYGDLSDDNLASIDAYIRQLIEERGLDADGPAPFEDEAEQPSKK